jgi:hypothetical protein
LRTLYYEPELKSSVFQQQNDYNHFAAEKH